MHMIFFLYVYNIINKTGLSSYFLFFNFRLYLNKPLMIYLFYSNVFKKSENLIPGFDHFDIVGVIVQLSNRSFFCLFVFCL